MRKCLETFETRGEPVKEIYVDVDDVIAKTIEMYIRTVDEEFGKTVSLGQISTFDLRVSFDLTEPEFRHLFDLAHHPDRLMAYEPVDGSVSVLRAWKEAGHRIHIVTGRPTAAKEPTLAWLKEREIPFDSFTMVDKYNRETSDRSVAVSKEELAERSYDLAVEDSVEMALFLAGQMQVRTALVNRPWNHDCPGHENLVRCRDWSAIRELA